MLKAWTPVLLIIARYVAAGLAAKFGWTEAEGKTLYEALTDPLVLLALATFLGTVFGGVKTWITLKRQALTAAAISTPKTSEQVAAISKVASPSINTPANEVPVLSTPTSGTSSGSDLTQQ